MHRAAFILTILIILAACTPPGQEQAERSIQNMQDRFDLTPLAWEGERVFTLTAHPTTLVYEGDTYTGFYAYNNLTPGPVVHMLAGERLTVHLINNLPENTTIHWHGVEVPNAMDGVPFVTQDPVPAGGIFTYSFRVDAPGVYWYHSHVNTDQQIERGLQGVLIVDDPNTTIPSARDRVIVLDDVRLQGNQLAPFRLLMDGHMLGRYGNAYLINGKAQDVFTAPRNALVRLRIVNTANARVWKLEASQPFIKLSDGIRFLEQPRVQQELILAPGERADILFNLEENPITLRHTNTRTPAEVVIILPEGEANETMREKAAAAWAWLVNASENYLEDLPDWDFARAWEPNITLRLEGGRDNRSAHGFTWRINDGFWPVMPDVQNLTQGGLYKIRYVNTQRIWHPMHVHGQKFVVLSVNGKEQEIDAWRDMVLVPPGGWVDILLKADNPGDWLEHCHILEHAELGMMGLFTITKTG